jgi:4-amino-4-deoxy-L-arabinose transferase-like glycosyltransferase
MLAVACAYAIARLLSGRFAAICAGLLVAVSYTLVQHAHYIKPGTLAGGWMMLAAWASLAALLASKRRTRLRFYLFACAVAGLAATTRYNAAAVSIIVASVGILLIFRRRSWRQ